MKRNISILISALSLFCISYHYAKGQNIKTLYTSHAVDNWFMGFGIGNSVYFGEDIYFNQLVYDQIIIPYLNVNGGKWYTPTIGARIQAGFCSLGGVNPRLYLKENASPVKERVNYIDANLNFMVNVFNLLGGYRERKFSFATYGGPGVTRSFNSLNFRDNFHLIFKAGGVLKYNLNRGLAVFTEIQGSLLPVSYQHGKVLDYDGTFTASAGISYTFKGKKRGFIPVQYDLSEVAFYSDDDQK